MKLKSVFINIWVIVISGKLCLCRGLLYIGENKIKIWPTCGKQSCLLSLISLEIPGSCYHIPDFNFFSLVLNLYSRLHFNLKDREPIVIPEGDLIWSSMDISIITNEPWDNNVKLMGIRYVKLNFIDYMVTFFAGNEILDFGLKSPTLVSMVPDSGSER